MTRLWRSIGNETSNALVGSWRTMCDTFNNAGTQQAEGWTALNMPTGIGKTQFAALYCALLPNPTLSPSNFRSIDPHPGVLFVTRFITEANKFVEQVNKHAGKKIAAAYYSNAPTSLAEAKTFPVLAITHAACERHQISHAQSTLSTSATVWDHITSWRDVKRRKVIIDETPSFINAVQLNAKAIAQTLGALKYLPDADPKLYFELEVFLTQITDARNGRKARRLDSGEYDILEGINTARMKDHLSKVEDYAITIDCDLEPYLLRKVCQTTLSAIEAIQTNGWGWVSFRGPIAQVHSASLHPSLRNGSGVILDGTASLYTGYELLSPPVRVVSAQKGVRQYGNVTLYVARGHKAGKVHLAENATKLWPQYRAAIEEALPDGERVLVCCHKDFRKKVEIGTLPRLSFAHYGDIDGRNDWESYEAVALLGLPYLDAATPANIAQTLLGVQTSEWLQNSDLRGNGAYDDILAALHRGHISSSAVQAICRVRCRNAVDSAGRCKRTSVFIALPNGVDGDTVLSAIINSMPGIQIASWNLDAASKRHRTAPATETIVDFFTTAPTAVYTKAQVRAATGISPSSLDRTIARMNSLSSTERRRLDALRVTYFPQLGRGAESYFVKA